MRLLARIAQTIDFAHQHGVLHRDLKPSNILIDERGDPHILDFGLAKAIDPGGSSDVSLSEPGQLLGTLGYMSPEQSRGQFDQISVRSDVYSLGAVGYECLAGALPVSVDGPLGEVLERIARQEPARPTVAARRVRCADPLREPRAARSAQRTLLSRAPSSLAADLDAILLKALAKNPMDRYATAAEFAADLRRCLNNQTIVARRVGPLGRAVRWGRRNRALAAVGGTALAVMGALCAAGLVQIRSERDRARTQAMNAGEIAAFLQRILASASPYSAAGPDVTLRQALDEAAHQIDAHPIRQPEVAASLRKTIGDAYGALGRYQESAQQFRDALAIRRSLARGDSLDVAQSLSDLGRARVAAGDLAAAEPLLNEALDIRKRPARRHITRGCRQLR